MSQQQPIAQPQTPLRPAPIIIPPAAPKASRQNRKLGLYVPRNLVYEFNHADAVNVEANDENMTDVQPINTQSN